MAVDINDWIQRIAAAGSTSATGTAAGATAPAAVRRVYLGQTDAVRTPLQLQRNVTAKNESRNPNVMAAVAQAGPRNVRGGYGFVANLTEDDTPDLESVRGKVYEWYGTEEFDRWGKHLLNLGLIDPEDVGNLTVLNDFWQDALELSARFMDVGKKVTPFEALRAMAQSGGAEGGRQAGFTGTKRHVSKSVDLTDPQTAQALVNNVLSQALGRDATEDELEAFRSTLNSYSRANPTISTTTSEFEDGEQVSSSTQTSGGVTQAGQAEMLRQEAMQLPDYGEFQAATTYFNALLGSLASPV